MPTASYVPAEHYQVWLQSGDAAVYEQRGAAENYALIHYRRINADYDGWGLHVWGDTTENVTWTDPLQPAGQDSYGIFWKVHLTPDAQMINFIVHKGDDKDPGPDESMTFADTGYEIWKIQGSTTQYLDPGVAISVLSTKAKGDLGKQQAYWVDEDTILWSVASDTSHSFKLFYDAAAGLQLDENGISGGQSLTLTPDPAGASDAVKAKFPDLAGLPALKIASADLPMAPQILKSQFAVEARDSSDALVDATGLQIPGVLDDLFSYDGDLGISWEGDSANDMAPVIRLWAPTAQMVRFHLFDDSDPATTSTVFDMSYSAATGVWAVTGQPDWKDKYFLFEVQVFAPTTGKIETNMVTDPYSLSLAMNSTRSQIVDLSDPALAPAGWDTLAKPPLAAPEDISIYELHVRDFSDNDPSVPDALKGTYMAFTLPNSDGIKHLKALQAAGLTHLHLLPVFDIATIDENKANWQGPTFTELAQYGPASEEQQALITATEDMDAFNWGYDPYHYTVPEGSYSTNPDGSTRIVEFRDMVEALNNMGLRVVLDVVYNHTNAAGESPKSVLDRVVPGYYHRQNKDGKVESASCCADTAAEHTMMTKLMVDSLVTWAKYYKIDAFRFDLMGMHPVATMEKIRTALDNLTMAEDGVDGKSIYIYGEGWNIVSADRGTWATQLNLAGTGIGTFDDRTRDAVRGPGPFDDGQDLKKQGFVSGLYFDPNDKDQGTPDQQKARLLLLSDQIRVGLTGNLAGYVFQDRNGNMVKGSEVDYNGQPAGYTDDPQEEIAYIDKHDNQTLYDIYAYGIPTDRSMADRVRAQIVGLSTVFLGQGVPFTQAGTDLLRSKSFDRDSYNSGDWFNKLDFTYQDNNFGAGLPVAGKNQNNWPIMAPLLADPNLKPAPADIEQTTDLFQELLRIRYSSPLFRLHTELDVQQRLAFHNTGPDQLPGLIAMTITDIGVPDLDPNLEMVAVLFNANDEAQTLDTDLDGHMMVLDPVQQQSVDPVVRTAKYDWQTGTFTIPARTTAVFVEPQQQHAFVTFPGDYVYQLGGYDWTPGDNTTIASDRDGDGVYKFVTSRLPAGDYRFRAAVGGTWNRNFGQHGSPTGDALSFTVAADHDLVQFYYDTSDNWVASRPGSVIPVVAGSFGDEIGGQDWAPANLTTWMKDKDGDWRLHLRDVGHSPWRLELQGGPE